MNSNDKVMSDKKILISMLNRAGIKYRLVISSDLEDNYLQLNDGVTVNTWYFDSVDNLTGICNWAIGVVKTND